MLINLPDCHWQPWAVKLALPLPRDWRLPGDPEPGHLSPSKRSCCATPAFRLRSTSTVRQRPTPNVSLTEKSWRCFLSPAKRRKATARRSRLLLLGANGSSSRSHEPTQLVEGIGCGGGFEPPIRASLLHGLYAVSPCITTRCG